MEAARFSHFLLAKHFLELGKTSPELYNALLQGYAGTVSKEIAHFAEAVATAPTPVTEWRDLLTAAFRARNPHVRLIPHPSFV